MTFPTITGEDWEKQLRDRRAELNVAHQQIATKLLLHAVETALVDVEAAIADAEESPLRVASEFLKGRQAMFAKALAVYRASVSK